MATLARLLADRFRVVEPFQRRSGGGMALTVAQHVADLREVVHEYCGTTRPLLVGSSWGAMLALAYAAAHPATVAGIVLIGCGTFDPIARAELQRRLAARLTPALRARLAAVEAGSADQDERLARRAELLLPVYSHDAVMSELGKEVVDAAGHEESWADMLRLQEAGVYPAAFAACHAPVLMLHGRQDPHPGQLVRASLAPWLPQLEYREWDACGHYPWLERAVSAEFGATLVAWLESHGAPCRVAEP